MQDRGTASFVKGFHTKPSMRQLHLHVISSDFQSPFMKLKKHWNSFNTQFFLTLEDVIATLEKEKTVEIDKNAAVALLKLPLRCHRCHKVFSTMPSLKQHILICDK